MEPEPTSRIIKYPDGQELSLEQAQAGSYVFAVGPEPDTIYAFEDGGAEQSQDESAAERQIEEWARENGVLERIERARAVVDELPPNPSEEFDVEAAQAERDRIAQKMQGLLDADPNLTPGSPEFLEKAHAAKFFNSAILYRGASYSGDWVPLDESCPDVPSYTGWPHGAMSCQTIGFTAVYLYEDIDYGPSRFTPASRLAGSDMTDLSPRSIRSVLFV
jgi:hypothetical protein